MRIVTVILLNSDYVSIDIVKSNIHMILLLLIPLFLVHYS